MSSPNFKDLSDKLTKYLANENLRKTSERFAILKEIYKMKNAHFDIDTLYFRILKNNFNISKATLYNNIKILIGAEILNSVDISSNTNTHMYEKGYLSSQHDHILCVNCGRIIEFCDPRIEQIKETLEQNLKIKIDKHSLNFYGQCKNIDECNDYKKKNKKKHVI